MNQDFTIEKTNINGVVLLKPFIRSDIRGYFLKDYSKEFLERAGITHELKEIFYTYSHKGVIRAIHFQRVKQQAKLVRCIQGKIFDVCVDLRKESKTFGQWIGFFLSEENKQQILIPEGCGHGYLVMEESLVSYQCGEQFYGMYDDGILWNDPDIGITWPKEDIKTIILSEKDQHLQTFQQFKETYQGF